MRQAIRVRWLSPTNYRPSRLIASCEAKSKTYAYKHELDLSDNYKHAAMSLASDLGWIEFGQYVGGVFNGDAYFVQLDSK